MQHLSTSIDSPLRPGQIGAEFQDCVAPIENEIIIQKQVNGAFIGTQLEPILRKLCSHDLVIAGLSTDHCVSTTVRMASNLGFQVTVLADATATFARCGFDGEIYDAQTVHDLALASLKGEFAKIVLTANVLGNSPSAEPPL